MAAEHLFNSNGAGVGGLSPGHLEMINTTLLSSSVDVFYRGRYISIPFPRLHEWFRNPAILGAELYQVTELVFRRWMEFNHEHGVGLIPLSCSHAGCRMGRALTFHDPHEMQEMEVRAASEIWYCHHHRESAWRTSGGLGDEHHALLVHVSNVPGCNRVQLSCKKVDTEFLISIGLLTSRRSPDSRRVDARAFYLTEEGERIVHVRRRQHALHS